MENKPATNFAEIIYDPTHHSYTYHGKPLTSVSKVISQLKPPFDRERIAQKEADKTGLTVAEVLAKWDKRGEMSRALGTRVHEWIAQRLRGELHPELAEGLPAPTDMFLALNQNLPEMDAFNKFWVERPGAGDPAVQIEWVIGDEELGIAGTVDAVLQGAPEYLHIFDWKTGSKFSCENRFQKCLGPFSDLDDCEFINYSLQLSLYRLIVERNTDYYQMGDSYIVHLTNQGEYVVHKAVDLRGRLVEWLTGGTNQ